MPSSHHWKRNDTNPITGTLLKNRVAVDIENASLQFHMKRSDGTLVVDAAATVVQSGDGSDGSMGKWSYSPDPADTATSGIYKAEVEVTYPDGTVESFPNKGFFRITIGDDLA